MITLHRLGTVTSTNVYARYRLDLALTSPVLLWAEAQTAGQGQPGRNFDSPVSGLYLSWILSEPPTIPFDLTLRWARHFADTLRPMLHPEDRRVLETVPLNDLFLGGRKVGGVLIERYRGHIIVGLGINVLPRDFPQELADIATSFYLTEDEGYGIDPLLERLHASVTSGFSP